MVDYDSVSITLNIKVNYNLLVFCIKFAAICRILSDNSNKLKKNRPRFGRITSKGGEQCNYPKRWFTQRGQNFTLVEDVAILYKQGIEVILVTSGAVAAGRSSVSPSRKTNIVAAKQIWAAIGQVKLMSSYQFLFGKYGIQAGQLLAAKESFRDRSHYLNMKNCILAMLENKVLPIVNENDSISID